MSKIILQCANCGDSFKRYPSKVTSGKDFCSRECYREDADKKVEVECDGCGDTYMKHRSEVDRTNHDFCSTRCHSKYLSSHESWLRDK